MKVAKFTVPLYESAVHLVWPATVEQYKSYMEDTFDYTTKTTDAMAWCASLSIKGSDCQLIGLSSWKKDPRHISILGHEVFHATHNILAFVGFGLSDKSCEAYTYVHEFIMKKCLEALWNSTPTK